MNKINTTNNNNNNNNKINTILTLFLLILVPFSYAADTNGVWHFAKDIQGGVFGQDEQVAGMHYRFINPVYFDQELYSKNIQNSENVYIGEKLSTKNLDVSDRADIDLAYVEELHAKNLRADSAYIDGDLNITGVTSGADIYSNGDLVITMKDLNDLGNIATTDYVQNYFNNSIGNIMESGTKIYLCPQKDTDGYIAQACSGYSRTLTCWDTYNPCKNTCLGGLSTSPTCVYSVASSSSCGSLQTFSCGYYGDIYNGNAPPVYTKTINFPNTHFGSGYNKATYCKSYSVSPTPKFIVESIFSKCQYEDHGWKTGICTATVEYGQIKICISASSGADGYGWETNVKYYEN